MSGYRDDTYRDNSAYSFARSVNSNTPPQTQDTAMTRNSTRDFVVASNKRAGYNYSIEKTFEAGLVLLGNEVKSLRHNRVSLAEAYAYEDNYEVWLANLHVPEYGAVINHNPRRLKKLLLHKYEILKIQKDLTSKGTTLVPLRLYFKQGHAKLLIALARGKSTVDKRQAIREREDALEAQRVMKYTSRRRCPQ